MRGHSNACLVLFSIQSELIVSNSEDRSSESAYKTLEKTFDVKMIDSGFLQLTPCKTC